MGRFTGTPPTGRLKRFGNALLDGLDALATAGHDSPLRDRIQEIDKQLIDLAQERDHAIAKLIEPGDLKPSENYNPNWSKPVATGGFDISPIVDKHFPRGEGRLTECKGRRSMSTYHDAHPGCPYVEKVHNPHEFTLTD